MHGAVAEVAGKTGLDGSVDRFQITHLANSDNAGLAAHRIAKTSRKALDVTSDLRLVRLRTFPVRTTEHEFNRIFVGDDLPVRHLVAGICIYPSLESRLA